MTDVIIPTWAEVNSYIALAIALAIFCVYAWNRGKREEERTVKVKKELEEW